MVPTPRGECQRRNDGAPSRKFAPKLATALHGPATGRNDTRRGGQRGGRDDTISGASPFTARLGRIAGPCGRITGDTHHHRPSIQQS